MPEDGQPQLGDPGPGPTGMGGPSPGGKRQRRNPDLRADAGHQRVQGELPGEGIKPSWGITRGILSR